jgi:hypothetical protein
VKWQPTGWEKIFAKQVSIESLNICKNLYSSISGKQINSLKIDDKPK